MLASLCRSGVLVALCTLLAACSNDTGTAASTGAIPYGSGDSASSGAIDAGSSSSGGATTDNCTPGERSCASLTEQKTCGAESRWTVTACAAQQACEDGACAAVVCTGGQLGCDGDKIVTCNARGTKATSTDVCVGDTECAGGQCIAKKCTTGEAKCVGNSLVSCNDQGVWDKTVCISTATCALDKSGNAKCQAHICTPGAATCDGGKAMQCAQDGLAATQLDDCATAGKDGKTRQCLGGQCVIKECDAGATVCDGDGVATCKGDMTGWDKAACKTGETCVAGACAKVLCAKGEVFCDALDVKSCSADGTVATTTLSCNGNLQDCKSGACVDKAIVCGDGFCDEGESLENCGKDCKEQVLVAPDFDHLPAKGQTQKPHAPRNLGKPAPHASYAGSTLGLGGKLLYAVDTDNNAVVLIDRETLVVQHTIKVGKRPEQLVVGPAGNTWISVRGDDSIVRLPAGKTAMADALKWQIGFEPIGVALMPDAKVLLVALHGESAVIALDATTGSEIGRAKVAQVPRSIAIGPKGKAIVTHGTGQVSVIDAQKMASGNALKPVLISGTFAGLRVANAAKVCRSQVEMKARNPSRALGAAIQPESGMMLVPHVLSATGSAQDVLAAAGVKPKVKPPPKPVTVCSSSGYGSTCKVIAPPPGPPPCISAPVRPYEITVSRFTPDMAFADNASSALPVKDSQSGRNFLARFDQPMGIVHHPTATMAFVPAMGTNNVMVINTDAPDPMQWPIADIAVGLAPRAIVISADGKTAYTQNAAAFTISKIDLAPLLLAVDPLAKSGQATKEMEPLFMQHASQKAYGTDPLDDVAALGRRVFHNSLNSRLNASNRFACATCHLDGTEDKQVWFIAEGPRQTPALAGRLPDTAPFNWMGSKFTLQDNIRSTTTRMGGTGLMQAELDALAKFIEFGLQPPRNPNKLATGLTAEQAEGKKLFFDPVVGCDSCHTGKGLTDGAQHDVGTATAVEVQVQKIFAGEDKPQAVVFNTPSLRDVFYTAPYLHDGSAATIKDALKKTATTMGKTSQLTDKQLDALVAYLKTL